MEACGTASEGGGPQYGCGDFEIKVENFLIDTPGDDGEEQCEFFIKHADDGLHECYVNICQSKEADETTTTIENVVEEKNVGMSSACRPPVNKEEANNVATSKEKGTNSNKKGQWKKEEDDVLRKVVGQLGSKDWVKIEMQSGLNRTSKSCRLRWKNHLQPHLKKGSFSPEEERDVIRMHYRFGNKWSLMAKRMPGRSDNEIKNLWHSRIKKCKKTKLPIYPDWCMEEDQTLDDDDLCMMSDVQTTGVPNSTDQPPSVLPNHDMFQYYPPSTSETSMINASCSMPSSETDFCLQGGGGGQSTLHHVSSSPGLNSFNQSTQVPLSPMDLSPRQLCPSFQHFLSPRPKTSQSSFTFSTAISSPHGGGGCSSPQLPYNKPPTDISLRDSNISIFETSKCLPILSLPSGRFKRSPRATIELPGVPNYNQDQSILNSAASVSSFHMNALTHSSSAPNLENIHSPISPLGLSKSSKVYMLPTNQSNKPTMTIEPPTLEFNSSLHSPNLEHEPLALHSFSSSPNLELESLALQSLDQHANMNTTSKDSSSCTWKPSASLLPCPYRSLETPSIQSHAREVLPTPEMNYDSNESTSENYTDLLDTLLQDAQIDSCLSDLQLVEQYLFNQQLNTRHLYQKIRRRKQYQNIIPANKGISSSSNLSREVPWTNFINQANDPLREQRKRNLEITDQSFMMQTSILKDVMSPGESLQEESSKRHRTMPKCDNCSIIRKIERDQTPAEDTILGQTLKDEELITSGQQDSLSGEIGHENEIYHTGSDAWNEILNTRYSEDDCFIQNIEAYEDTIVDTNLDDVTTETLLLDSQDFLHGSSSCYPP